MQENTLERRRAVEVVLGIIRRGKPRTNRHDVRGLESQTNIQQVPEAAQQQTRGNHQDDR